MDKRSIGLIFLVLVSVGLALGCVGEGLSQCVVRIHTLQATASHGSIDKCDRRSGNAGTRCQQMRSDKVGRLGEARIEVWRDARFE